MTHEFLSPRRTGAQCDYHGHEYTILWCLLAPPRQGVLVRYLVKSRGCRLNTEHPTKPYYVRF